MKKGFLKNLFLYSFSTVAILLIYLLLYVFPSIKSISKIQIMTKDYRLRSRDFKKSENNFVKPDKKEEMLLRKVEREFEKYIPLINESGSQKRYLEDIKEKMEEIFLGAGIDDSIFKFVEKDGFKGDSGLIIGPETFLLGRYKVRSGYLTVSFKATFNELTALLKGISSLRSPLLINVLRGNKIKKVLLLRIKFDIFFRVQGSVKKSLEAGNFIDINSPLLLDRVYKNAVERVGK